MRQLSSADLRLRRLLLGILTLGLVGTGTELLLIGHDEDVWQLIPLVVMGIAALSAAPMLAERPAPARVTIFRAVMVLLMVTGAFGAFLHYRANMEFKLEMDPSLGGMALFMSVVKATAPPALAPGNLALLGLVGLASTYGIARPAAQEPLGGR